MAEEPSWSSGSSSASSGHGERTSHRHVGRGESERAVRPTFETVIRREHPVSAKEMATYGP